MREKLKNAGKILLLILVVAAFGTNTISFAMKRVERVNFEEPTWRRFLAEENAREGQSESKKRGQKRVVGKIDEADFFEEHTLDGVVINGIGKGVELGDIKGLESKDLVEGVDFTQEHVIPVESISFKCMGVWEFLACLFCCCKK